MVTPGAKRDAVAHARGCYGFSERRACHLIGIPRRVARCEPCVADDTHLRQRLRELAAARQRFGYRRLGYLLAREGLKPNHKKLLGCCWFGGYEDKIVTHEPESGYDETEVQPRVQD